MSLSTKAVAMDQPHSSDGGVPSSSVGPGEHDVARSTARFPIVWAIPASVYPNGILELRFSATSIDQCHRRDAVWLR